MTKTPAEIIASVDRIFAPLVGSTPSSAVSASIQDPLTGDYIDMPKHMQESLLRCFELGDQQREADMLALRSAYHLYQHPTFAPRPPVEAIGVCYIDRDDAHEMSFKIGALIEIPTHYTVIASTPIDVWRMVQPDLTTNGFFELIGETASEIRTFDIDELQSLNTDDFYDRAASRHDEEQPEFPGFAEIWADAQAVHAAETLADIGPEMLVDDDKMHRIVGADRRVKFVSA